jgi:hypothetical protein
LGAIPTDSFGQSLWIKAQGSAQGKQKSMVNAPSFIARNYSLTPSRV